MVMVVVVMLVVKVVVVIHFMIIRCKNVPEHHVAKVETTDPLWPLFSYQTQTGCLRQHLQVRKKTEADGSIPCPGEIGVYLSDKIKPCESPHNTYTNYVLEVWKGGDV